MKREFEADGEFYEELRRKTLKFAGEDFQYTVNNFFTYALVRLCKPKLIVETGVFDGYFSACFLRALQKNVSENGSQGRLISIDLPAYQPIVCSTDRCERGCLPPGCEPGWVIPDWLRANWRLHLGDSRKLLPEIVKQVGNIDMFFHDSLHTYDHMTFEYETVWPLLRQGSILLSHDIHWNRAFRTFIRKYRQKEFAVHGFGVLKKN